MVNLDNLNKVIGKKIAIVLKYGNELSVSGKLLRLEDNDIIVECSNNYTYDGANVRNGEAHVPVSALAMWFLIKVYE